jgi:hypothetical protein
VGIYAGWRCEGSKAFFFEKRKQKTVAPAPFPPDPYWLDRARNPGEKVFWFFFSKKNILSSFCQMASRIK